MLTRHTDYVNRLADLLAGARSQAGVSQAQLAKEMGIAKKTVQNWEAGISIPTLLQTIEWFHVLGINPFPHFQAFLYPGILDTTSVEKSEEDARKELHRRVDSLSDREVRDLLYILSGTHGSSPYAYLQMGVANLQTQIGDRQTVAMIVQNNYRNASAMNNLVAPDEIQPDMEALDLALRQSVEAFRNQSSGYVGVSHKESQK